MRGSRRKDGVPRGHVARSAGEVVPKASWCQRDQRDGCGSPRPAAAEIALHDQCPLVSWPDAVAVDEREPGSPGVRDGLTGPRIGAGRGREPAEEVGDAGHLVFAAVGRPNREPLGSGLVRAALARSLLLRADLPSTSQVAGETAVHDEMQARGQILLDQVAAVPALDYGAAWLGDDQAEGIEVGKSAAVER